MPIQALIAHHITCTPESGTTLSPGSRALPVDAAATALVDALKGSFFSRLSREHGSFADEGDPAPLPRALGARAEQQPDLVALSGQLLADWKTLLDPQPQPLDADVICFTEQHGDSEVLYLLVAGHKTAYTVGADLAIEETRHLDLGPSLFGIKVDLHEWRTARHYAYLSLVPPRGNRPLADSFAVLTGFTPGLDKTDTTAAFLAGVEAFSREVDPDQADSYRSQVVDYCADREARDAPVDLGELARAVDGIDGERFSRFMSDYTPDDHSALMLDRRSLRRYVKFAGREKDLAISFSSSQLNSRVHYDADRDTLSIDGIPRSLREQLLRHFNQ